MPTRIAYFVHDLTDAAVSRRVRLFQAGGAAVTLAGFSRREPPATVEGAPATPLGRTADAQLGKRMLSVVGHLARPAHAARVAAGADVLVARNLEMLAIAARVRRPGQRLVYECLDIHRLMLGQGAKNRTLRALERWLLAACQLVITSSPAFIERYFHALQGYAGPIRLVENKVLALEGEAGEPVRASHPAGSPWRIGWFGMLRCTRTLAMLSAIARAGEGRIEVVIAGKPSAAEFADFAGAVAAAPGLRYLGPYTPADLPRLYGEVDFTWTVDFFEEGLNSRWLLPNRLYEGLAHGAVPVSMPGLAIADWLEEAGVGLLFDDLERELPPFLLSLDETGYRALADDVSAVPRERLVATRAEAQGLMQAVAA